MINEDQLKKTIDEIKHLVAADELKKALSLLKNIDPANTDIETEGIVIEARLADFQKAFRQGVEQSDSSTKALIRLSILGLANSILSSYDSKSQTIQNISKTADAPNREAIEDIQTHYHVKILNEAGDAAIERSHRVLINSQTPVFSRSHKIFCDLGPMPHMQDIEFRAWDDAGTNLKTSVQVDQPKFKEFYILFPRSLTKGEEFIYFFRFIWKKMFHPQKDYYTLSGGAKIFQFKLSFPKPWNMIEIRAEENFPDGRKADLPLERFLPFFKENELSSKEFLIRRDNGDSTVKVFWEILTS